MGLLSPTFVRTVAALIAFGAVLGWAAAVVAGIIFSFTGDDAGFLEGEGMTFFMPGLTALVGGVVAAAFGQETPPPPGSPNPRLDRNVSALGNVLTAAPMTTHITDPQAVQRQMAKLYVIAYLAFGFFAAVTWIIKAGDTLEYVRTLASAWGGLSLAIAHAFFTTSGGPPPPPPPAPAPAAGG